jgi:hypothetical protein
MMHMLAALDLATGKIYYRAGRHASVPLVNSGVKESYAGNACDLADN